MMQDKNFDFGTPAITTSNTTTKSANEYDAGSSKKVFGNAGDQQLGFYYKVDVTAGTNPTVKVDIIGSDESDLDPDNSEGSNTVLGSTGVLDMKQDGSAALESGDTLEGFIPIQNQQVARRYYGALLTLGGTDPSASAGECVLTRTPQTNMRGAQAAVPAT